MSRILAEFGASVVDADLLAHELIDPGGAAHDAVVERFGSGILHPDGRIDRAALGRIVFADAEARAALNALVHPGVRAEAARRFEAAAVERRSPVAVFDAALLVESGTWREFDRLVVVSCRRETQIRRLAARDGLDRAQAEARIDAQAPLEHKLALAHHVIDTEGPLEATRRQTAALWDELLEDARALGATG